MEQSLLARRRLIRVGVPVLGAVAAGGLLLRSQLHQPLRAGQPAIDFKPRHLRLATAQPQLDPVLLAARETGSFQRYNLDVELLAGVASDDAAVGCVQAGRASGAVAPVLSWLPHLLEGMQARLVCGLHGGTSRMLIARQSPMRRIEDLFRHAVGLSSIDSGADRLFFSIVMRRKGMHPAHDVTWRAMPRAALSLALAEGEVRAIIGHDPFAWEVRQSLHLGELASSQSGSYAVRVGRVLGLSTPLLQSDPKAAVALTLALQEAATWAASHGQAQGATLAAEDPRLTPTQFARMLQAEGGAVHPIGVVLQNQIAQYIDELKLLGVAPQNVDSGRVSRSIVVNVRKL